MASGKKKKFTTAPSDPTNGDTDRGGNTDGKETRAGSNPDDRYSRPGHPRMQVPGSGL